MGGVFLGFTNYVMDVKDNKKRPLLLGFLNFLNVATSILPVIGGIMVEQLPYEIIFVSSAIPIGFALIFTRQLNEKIHDLLRITKLEKIFEIYPDSEKAVKSFNNS